MKQLELLWETLEPLLGGLSAEERNTITAAFGRVDNGIARLTAHYDLAIQGRAAVHALLKKTSDDLIQRYQTLFEYTGTAMAVIEDDGTVSLANSFFEKLFGYSRGEVENRKKFADFIDESYTEMLLDYHRRRCRGDPTVPRDYEAKAITKEGKVLDIVVNVVLFPGTKQSIASVMDITERKRAEEALCESEERYRTVFENTGTATVILEADTTISLANTQFERLAGYPRSEIEGQKRWIEFVVPEDLARMEEQHRLRRKKRETALTRYEFRFISRSGEIHDILLNIDMIPGTTKSVASLTDITERKNAEDALRRSEIRLANAMDLARMVKWEADVASGVFTFDDRFYSLYGTSAAREGGNLMPFEVYAREFVHPDDMQLVAGVIAGTLEGTAPDYQQVEHRIVRRNGEIRHIVVRIKSVKDSSGRPVKVFGANQDITERKRIEESLQKKNTEAEILHKQYPGHGLADGSRLSFYCSKPGIRQCGGNGPGASGRSYL